MNQSEGDTIQAGKLPWLPLVPGVRIKPLRLQEATGEFTVMIRAEPNAILPRHTHLEASHIYIVAGKGRHPQTGAFEPGDYVYERKGAIHEELRFTEETILFMVNMGPSAFLGPDDSVLYKMDIAMLKQLQARGAS